MHTFLPTTLLSNDGTRCRTTDMKSKLDDGFDVDPREMFIVCFGPNDIDKPEHLE